MSINAYDQIQYSRLNLPTMQEMMIAPQYLTQRHDEALDAIGQLEAEGATIENLASTSEEARRRLTQYQKSIEDAANALMTEGAGKGIVRSKIQKAKAAYASNILPVLQADTVRKQDLQAISQARLQGDNLLIDPNTLNLDNYISNNGTSVLGNAVSSKALQTTVAAKVAGLANHITGLEREEDRELAYTFLEKIQKGISPVELQAYITGNMKDTAIGTFLQNAVNSTLTEFGVPEKFGNNETLLEAAYSNAASGIYAAIGANDIRPIQDNYSMQVSMQDRAFRQQWDMQKDAQAHQMNMVLLQSKLKETDSPGGRKGDGTEAPGGDPVIFPISDKGLDHPDKKLFKHGKRAEELLKAESWDKLTVADHEMSNKDSEALMDLMGYSTTKDEDIPPEDNFHIPFSELPPTRQEGRLQYIGTALTYRNSAEFRIISLIPGERKALGIADDKDLAVDIITGQLFEKVPGKSDFKPISLGEQINASINPTIEATRAQIQTYYDLPPNYTLKDFQEAYNRKALNTVREYYGSPDGELNARTKVKRFEEGLGNDLTEEQKDRAILNYKINMYMGTALAVKKEMESELKALLSTTGLDQHLRTIIKK